MEYQLTDRLLNITRDSVFTGDSNYRISVTMKSKYTVNNETYLGSEILGEKHLGKCQSTGTYKWGFSFLMLFPFLALLLIWTVGTWLMWLKAHIALQAQEKSMAGDYKAILCLAAAILEQSAGDNANIDSLTEKELRDKIVREMGGGLILDQQGGTQDGYSLRLMFFRGNKPLWWLAFGSASILLAACTALRLAIGLSLYASIFVGLAIALVVGRSDRSKLALVGPFVVLGLILSSVVLRISY